MTTQTKFVSGIWALTAGVVAMALFVWWPSTRNLTPYSLFPLLGLVAFGLMWTHYIAGALRRYFNLPKEILQGHFRITSYLVLLLILAHPLLLELQLYLDGLGLPHQSLPAVYADTTQRLAIVAGIIALSLFLLFELYRFFQDRSWWRWVEWANIAAMFLILWHGFTLGGELRQPWFQAIWFLYGLLLVGAVAYTEYKKRKDAPHGTNSITQ